MRISRAGIYKDSNVLQGEGKATTPLPSLKLRDVWERYPLLVTYCGFTFLELLVVIFIISVVLAITLPSFTGIGESRVKSDARRVSSIVRYLNDSAISTKDAFQMQVDFRDKLVRYNGPDGEKSDSFDSLSGIELQSRGMVSEGEVVVFFGPSGASESFVIHLKDDASSLTVALNNMSGKVKIAASNENRQ